MEETPDHFLVYQSGSESGVIVLGSKYLITKFFQSRVVLSDGTFKISPNGYKQLYILWFVNEATVENEEIPRNKAIAAIYFIMKTKSGAEYREAFKALEEYR